MYGLGLKLRAGRGASTSPNQSGSSAAFQMTSLWANGEDGAWYDIDPNYMFRLPNGLVRLGTGGGENVGVRLDRRTGEHLSANVVPGYDEGSINNSSTDEALVATAGTLTTQWTPVTAGEWYYVAPIGGTATRRRVQTKTAGGVISFQAGMSFEGADIDVIFQIPVGATQMRIYFKNVGDTATGLGIQHIPGHMALQATTGQRPFYQLAPARIDFDGAGDNLVTTFSSDLGTNVTVARAVPGVGASILTGQTVGTTYTNTTDDSGLIIVDRALTVDETAEVTAYLNTLSGV